MEILETSTIGEVNTWWQERKERLERSFLFVGSEIIGIEKDKIIIGTPIDEMFRLRGEDEKAMWLELRRFMEGFFGEGIKIEIRRSKAVYPPAVELSLKERDYE